MLVTQDEFERDIKSRISQLSRSGDFFEEMANKINEKNATLNNIVQVSKIFNRIFDVGINQILIKYRDRVCDYGTLNEKEEELLTELKNTTSVN